MIATTTDARIHAACSTGYGAGAESVTRIAQTVGRYVTVSLVRFDAYDAVGDTYGVVWQYAGPDSAPDMVTRFDSRAAAADAFADGAEISGL